MHLWGNQQLFKQRCQLKFVHKYIDKRYIVCYYNVRRYNEIRYIVTRYNARYHIMDDIFRIEKYLPLTETTYYTLLALIEPLHGYGVMQKVKEMSRGVVEIGPGTLYGAFSKLMKEGLIQKVQEDNRRKIYTLTNRGKELLRKQIERLEIMTLEGSKVIKDLE